MYLFLKLGSLKNELKISFSLIVCHPVFMICLCSNEVRNAHICRFYYVEFNIHGIYCYMKGCWKFSFILNNLETVGSITSFADIKVFLFTKNTLFKQNNFSHQYFNNNFSVSRISALSMLAVLSDKLALVGFVLHGALMSTWLLLKPDLNHNKCDECVLNCMLGIAYIFVYISSHTGPQRYSYWWYYIICFAENIGCLFAWYVINLTFIQFNFFRNSISLL